MVQKPANNNRSRMIAAITAVALVIFLAALNVVLMSANNSLKNDVAVVEKEKQAVKDFLNSFNEKRKQIIPINMNELSQVIDEITKLGGEKDIDFIAIQSQKVRSNKKSIYQKMPLEISLKSEFKELGLFLGALRELKTASVFISEFKVEPDAQSAPLVRSHVIAEVLVQDAEIQ